MRFSRAVTGFMFVSLFLLAACGSDRNQFIGSYSVNESCDTLGSFTYTMSVTASSTNPEGIILTGFAGLGNISVNGEISGNMVYIPAQTYSISGAAIILQGEGSTTGDILSITYEIETGAGNDHCIMVCEKLP